MVEDTDQEQPQGTGRSSSAPRHSRRLSDKILIAFHHACDQGDYEVAEELLRILEMMLTRRPVAPGTERQPSPAAAGGVGVVAGIGARRAIMVSTYCCTSSRSWRLAASAVEATMAFRHACRWLC